MTLRYDSETGQWIDSEAEETAVQQVVGAEAGQTASDNTAQAASVQQSANPIYNPIPEEPEKKNRKPLFIGMGAAALICLVIGVIAALGLFENPSQKILTALQNTFKDETKTAEFFQQLEELVKDEYTISAKGSMDGTTITLEYHNDRKEPQLRGSYENYWLDKMEFLASITENKVKMQSSYFGDYVFTYDYQGEKTGVLFQNEASEDIEMLDLLCEYLYDINSQKPLDDEILHIFLEEYNSWKFQKIEAKTFRINGERVKCDGYKAIVGSERFVSVVERIEDLYVENGMDYWNTLPDYMDNPFEEIYAALEDILDMEITFYLTKEQVACILLDVEEEQMKITFKGNKNGAQDIEVELDNYPILGIVHETVKTKEITKVSLYGTDAVFFAYDVEKNNFDLSVEYEYFLMSLSGNMEIDEEEMRISLDTLSIASINMDDLECEIAVKKGANIEEIVGEELELSTATEDELDKILGQIYDSLPKEDSGNGFYGEESNDYGDYYDFYNDYGMTPEEMYEEYFYDLTPEEFLELFPQYGLDDITGEANL